MQREEENERKKIGELQAKLEGIKINKDVALKANQSSKQGLLASPRPTSKTQLVIPKQSSKFKR
jgi:hypothetical protein